MHAITLLNGSNNVGSMHEVAYLYSKKPSSDQRKLINKEQMEKHAKFVNPLKIDWMLSILEFVVEKGSAWLRSNIF